MLLLLSQNSATSAAFGLRQGGGDNGASVGWAKLKPDSSGVRGEHALMRVMALAPLAPGVRRG